ncbi:MAG: hypothetical protein QM680_02525 [Luteolibacter sp.]
MNFTNFRWLILLILWHSPVFGENPCPEKCKVEAEPKFEENTQVTGHAVQVGTDSGTYRVVWDTPPISPGMYTPPKCDQDPEALEGEAKRKDSGGLDDQVTLGLGQSHTFSTEFEGFYIHPCNGKKISIGTVFGSVTVERPKGGHTSNSEGGGSSSEDNQIIQVIPGDDPSNEGNSGRGGEEKDDQGEIFLEGEILDETKNKKDEDRGIIPTYANAYKVIGKKSEEPGEEEKNDVGIDVLHRIVTINSEPSRDLKGNLKIEVEEGESSQYVIFRKNKETGEKTQISLPYNSEVTEPGHVGTGIHDWHEGHEEFVFRRKGDGFLKLRISVDPVQGDVVKTTSLHLLPVELKDYYGGDKFLNRISPKCFSQKVLQKMLTHEYPEKGSDGSVYIQNGDTFDLSVRVPELQSFKYELVYELLGMEIQRKTILGSDSLQVVKFDPNIEEMSPWKLALGSTGFEMKVHLVISKDGNEILKSPDYKFLVDDAVLRNALFKIKVNPLAPGSKMKGSYSEIMMGMMLHEVSLEIVSLIEKNTRDHTVDVALKLNDPSATQGTNRLIIRTLGDQMEQAGSEWDQAATDALALEQAIGVKFWKYPDVIFNQVFPKFEAIENRVRGEGWGSFGCPCGGDKEILKQASLRGVSSKEIDKILANYTPAGTLGLSVVPSRMVQWYKDYIKNKKLPDLEKNFDESWIIGGCCQ